MGKSSAYDSILEQVFLSKYKPGASSLRIEREDLARVCSDLGIAMPKNLGDVVYSFRYRKPLPMAIRSRAPKGKMWIIRPAGRGRYEFVLIAVSRITPNEGLALTKVPDATPGIIAKYSLTDEQALLARVRYNRLVDIFTGVTCYSLQSHLRTTVPALGQVETDEIYVGVDKRGSHYVFPVQAKGANERVGIVQIEQDLAVCRHKFPGLICRALAAQAMADSAIALFEFEQAPDRIRIVSERHYLLVPPDDISEEELAKYFTRADD